MIEVILGTLIIVGFTILIAFIKVDKNRSNICHFNCENCKERNVCKIKK
ncbi:hypothetical protein H1057_19560 [Clostridium sporogenes]|nr:hypothetical protein [Clostridium sporogenes]MBA4510204.1 hypothetical protein [Clostridium sporogenes]